MARNILVVEDDRNISDLIRMYLDKEGFEVRIAYDGGKAVEEFEKQKPDLVLLDIMLPVLDGWGVCAKIREKAKTPIIMLTAKGDVGDRITGLEMGADDYIVKPFEMKELMARINAVLRRSEIPDDTKKRLTFDKLVIDLDSYELIVDGKKIDTPPKELELLYHLASTRATSCSTRCGALTISATAAPWTSTSSACARRWKTSPTSGSSRRSGAWAISLKSNENDVCIPEKALWQSLLAAVFPDSRDGAADDAAARRVVLCAEL